MSIFMPHMNSLQSTITGNTVIHAFHITGHMHLNRYVSHIEHTCSIALLLKDYLQTSQHCKYKSNKQQSTTFNYHAIAIYVPTPNMPLKCNIFATNVN